MDTARYTLQQLALIATYSAVNYRNTVAPRMGAKYDRVVRVIARATLTRFVSHRVERKLQRSVKEHLDAWFAEVSRAEWKTSADLKQQYRSASIVSAERVVFNIKGNEFRLIISVNYTYGVLFIKWIGTHREYDNIAVEEVDYDENRYGNSSR